MTLLDDIGQPDLGLVTEVRSGRSEAFAELYRRHHPAVLRYALSMTRGDEARAQDLVSEAFARVFDAVTAGRGSGVAFRPYVLAAVRNEYVTELRRWHRVELVEFPEELDDRAPYGWGSDHDELDPKLCRAFRRLPPRWQVVLWHTEIEDDRPAEVGQILGLSPNAVSALASRARERLRQEYLQEHVMGVRPECRSYAARFARHVRGKLGWRDRRALNAHLESCADCSKAHADLAKLNSEMRGVLAPALMGLGGAGPFLSGSGQAVAPAVAGATGLIGATGIAGSGVTLGHGLGVAASAGLGGASLAQLGAGAAAAAVATMAVFGLSVPPAPQEADDPVLAAEATPDAEEHRTDRAADPGAEQEEPAGSTPAVPTPSPEATAEQTPAASGEPVAMAGAPVTERPDASVTTTPEHGTTTGSEDIQSTGSGAPDPASAPATAKSPSGGKGPAMSGNDPEGPWAGAPGTPFAEWAAQGPAPSPAPPSQVTDHPDGAKASGQPDHAESAGKTESWTPPAHGRGDVTQITPDSRHESACPPVSTSTASDCRGRGERHSPSPPG